ncbi:polysaccharide deacetylase [Paenibacillus sp. J31TS4]|nr:polysaccharide deacetylase [Paenibacillus sp. J31TS4]
MLMYHHISPNEEGVTITQERFAQQMQALEDASYRVISMEEYIGFMKENKPVPPNAVVITFDDGYESYYRFAYPEMKKHGFTGTNFVIVSYVDMPNPSLPYLTWDQIQEMKKDGFSFYSHTYNLHIKKSNGGKEPVPALTNRLWLDKENRLETEEEYRKRVKEDLLLAEQTLKEKLGNEQSILCFPFGAYNKTVLEIAREAGIQYYSTINDGINTQNGREFVRVHAGVPNMSADKLLAKLAKFSDTGKSR